MLGGGRGWVLSAAAGAFALELLFILLTSLGVPSTWRDTVQGLIIIAAVAPRRAPGRSAGARAVPSPRSEHEHHQHHPPNQPIHGRNHRR